MGGKKEDKIQERKEGKIMHSNLTADQILFFILKCLKKKEKDGVPLLYQGRGGTNWNPNCKSCDTQLCHQRTSSEMVG